MKLAMGAFTSKDEFTRHVRNMAGLGLILYVWGILTGYVPNWVSVMIAIGGMTLQFSDFYWGRTKGGGYFWIYLAVQGFSNFMPFQFPVDAEAWKVMTNEHHRLGVRRTGHAPVQGRRASHSACRWCSIQLYIAITTGENAA